ncbi:hypothetical protein AYO45_04145 [Gammaproteobacteria bacterium SCGC AG-212-F23]|nr:hypothetical protein AYO45_04145 [Gammaproteobacteria bacterium SCGC AG-212-F23]
MVQPNLSVLQGVAKLARPNATLTLLINYSTFMDKEYVARLGLPPFDITAMEKLALIYSEAGIYIEKWSLLDKNVPHKTTWGQKLTQGGATRTTLLIQAKIR